MRPEASRSAFFCIIISAQRRKANAPVPEWGQICW
jgi:hypothetical protein